MHKRKNQSVKCEEVIGGHHYKIVCVIMCYYLCYRCGNGEMAFFDVLNDVIKNCKRIGWMNDRCFTIP